MTMSRSLAAASGMATLHSYRLRLKEGGIFVIWKGNRGAVIVFGEAVPSQAQRRARVAHDERQNSSRSRAP